MNISKIQNQAGDGGYMEPEYIRTAQASILTGISRSTWYDLMRRGEIEFITFRKPGMMKATRLLSVRAIREFMAAHTEGATAK